MAINDWDAAVLCTDADILKEEPKAVSWNSNQPLAVFRGLAKEEIGRRLRYSLRQQALAAGIDIDDILDHIEDYTPLMQSAVYMSIHKLCKGAVAYPNDLNDIKAREAFELFNDEYSRAVGMLSLDVDDSGTIEDSEKFNMDNDSTFIMGG